MTSQLMCIEANDSNIEAHATESPVQFEPPTSAATLSTRYPVPVETVKAPLWPQDLMTQPQPIVTNEGW